MSKLLLVLVAVVFLSGCGMTSDRNQIEEKCGWNDCCLACDKFGYEFLKDKYSSEGWGREEVDECYCKVGNEVKQIY